MEDLVRVERRLELAADVRRREDVDVRALVLQAARAAERRVDDLHDRVALPWRFAEHGDLRRNHAS